MLNMVKAHKLSSIINIGAIQPSKQHIYVSRIDIRLQLQSTIIFGCMSTLQIFPTLYPLILKSIFLKTHLHVIHILF